MEFPLTVTEATEERRALNDSLRALRLSTMLFTALNAFFFTWAALGKKWTDQLFLPLLVAAYLLINGLYSIVSAFTHRHRIRLQDEKALQQDHDPRFRNRRGERIGAGFALYLLLLMLFGAFGVGPFVPAPSSLYWGFQFTVGIIAATSTAKIVALPNRPRSDHNSVLLFLSFCTTISFAILIGIRAFGGTTISPEYFWAYTTVLSSYTGHNIVLSLLCPKYVQRRRGHLIGIGVIFYCALLFILAGFELLVVFPHEVFLFLGITAFIFAAGGSVRYFLEEPLIRRFLRSNHSVEDIDYSSEIQ